MTRRENMRRILRREGGDRVPFCFSFTRKLAGEFEQRSGSNNVEEFYDFDFRNVGRTASRQTPDYTGYYCGRTLKPGTVFDGNGVAHEPGSVEHFTHYVSPLAGRQTTVADADAYPLADNDADYRFEGLEARVADIHARGYATAAFVGHIFETAWQIRGMEDFLVDLHEAPDIAHSLLERLTRQNVTSAARFGAAGVDVIMVGDDVGTQHGMMMSPAIWRAFLKDRLRREIQAARDVQPDCLVWYHSDGDITAIIPDLIEVGVDILNPVQPECVDPVQLKRQFGDRLSFWGTIGTQTTMPFGTPDDVRKVVRTMIDQVGYNGGLVLAPTHVLEPEVPWANIDAFVDACREYGAL